MCVCVTCVDVCIYVVGVCSRVYVCVHVRVHVRMCMCLFLRVRRSCRTDIEHHYPVIRSENAIWWWLGW